MHSQLHREGNFTVRPLTGRPPVFNQRALSFFLFLPQGLPLYKVNYLGQVTSRKTDSFGSEIRVTAWASNVGRKHSPGLSP